MRLSKGDNIAGFPAALVRALMRVLGENSWSTESFILKGDETPATVVVPRLVEAGLIEGSEDKGWRRTISGGAVANASFGRPVSRKVAQRHCDGLLARAEEINADAGYLYWVERLVLFGSFLDPTIDPVGDVDVALELTRRYEDPHVFYTRAMERAEASGRRFSTIVQQFGWSETEIVQYLKAGSPVLSLTDTQDRVLSLGPTRVIYTRRDGHL